MVKDKTEFVLLKIKYIGLDVLFMHSLSAKQVSKELLVACCAKCNRGPGFVGDTRYCIFPCWLDDLICSLPASLFRCKLVSISTRYFILFRICSTFSHRKSPLITLDFTPVPEVKPPRNSTLTLLIPLFSVVINLSKRERKGHIVSGQTVPVRCASCLHKGWNAVFQGQRMLSGELTCSP